MDGQRGVCDMITHTATELNLKFRFRSTYSKTVGIYFGVDEYTGSPGVLSREWNIIHVSGKLWLYIFSPGLPDEKIELLDVGYNNGEWHNIEASWVSNGVGLGGVFTVVVDGVTKTATTAIDTMVFTGSPLTFNGRAEGASILYPCAFDLDYFEVANTRFNFSSGWGDKIYSTDGSKFVQLYNQIFATVWKQDDTATPHNFLNGFYLYENGNAGEELRYPIQLEVADIPAGYTYSGYYPPLVFGNMESGFKVPYNAIIAAADTEGKLYDGTTPKEIKFSDLVTGGFGNKIKYVGTVAEGFRKFCVKK